MSDAITICLGLASGSSTPVVLNQDGPWLFTISGTWNGGGNAVLVMEFTPDGGANWMPVYYAQPFYDTGATPHAYADKFLQQVSSGGSHAVSYSANNAGPSMSPISPIPLTNPATVRVRLGGTLDGSTSINVVMQPLSSEGWN